MARVSLVFPPHWYYACVPADLLYTGSHLQASGIAVRCWDLHAELLRDLLSPGPSFVALRDPATYVSADRYHHVSAAVDAECAAISARYQVDFSFYSLAFPEVDEGSIPQALAVGLDPERNPALPTLQRAVQRLLTVESRDARRLSDPASAAGPPDIIAVALVHPGQLVQALTLGRLLRQAGYPGLIVAYGAHEDVLAPEDFAPDLLPRPGEPLHRLFADFDGVIFGEAESALVALAAAVQGKRTRESVPSFLCPRWGLTAMPRRGQESLRELAPADFSLVDATLYPYPTPVVDLRMSRGCPWGKCTFCAIAMHQEGYRSRPTATATTELLSAQAQLGSRFFRFRDDLLTPRQLRELSAQLGALPTGQRARFSARARFEPGFTREVLRDAAAAGLEELWLGLESAVPRVRDLMKKGVAQPIIERILVDAADAGIRVRALCMIGYPGETAADIRQTFAFLGRVQPLLASVSMTPFLLMRRAPMGQDPRAFGLTVLSDADPGLPQPHPEADPVPRHERLRFALRAHWPGALPPTELANLIDECAVSLGPHLIASSGGPSLAHAWLHASARRHGWPGALTTPSLDAPPADGLH